MNTTLLLLTALLGTTPASADDRSADSILQQIDALKLPDPDPARADDKAYSQQFFKRVNDIQTRKAEWIGELYRIDPDHPRLVTLLPARWRWLSGRMAGQDDNVVARDLTPEQNEVLARSKSAALKAEAAYIKAEILSDPLDRKGAAKNKTEKSRAVDDFIAFAPQDERGAKLLYLLSLAFADDSQRQKLLYQRIVKAYPKSDWARLAQGLLDRFAAVGKPLDLTFNDAITGAEISMHKLRGKLVVIDFWATWCGPCVAEIPRMKQIYSKFHGKGVEFIGVSWDSPAAEGGLDQLRSFVDKNQISWPQYLESHTIADRDFSVRQGVNSIPTVFLVDRQGKVVSVDARDNLESLLLDLLKHTPPPVR